MDEEREATLREWVANALIKKGVALVSMGRINQALEAYDDVLARFGDARAPVLQEWVATALVKEGMILVALGLVPAALDVYNEILRRFGDAAEGAAGEAVADAHFFKQQMRAGLL